MSSEAEVRARNLEIIKRLRKGYTPRTVIEWVIDTYKLSPSTSKDVVYKLNSVINKSLKELTDEAAEYITNVLVNEIEDCSDDGDRKNKLKAVELLAKTLKVGDVKETTDLNIHFDFGE